ncbi:MAG: VirB4 family type IV secretion system protein, partial [Deltaproteobacteria bacterium]
MNSISEGTYVQWVFNVRSDFSHTLNAHHENGLHEVHPVIRELAEERFNTLTKAIKENSLYRPELRIYLKTTSHFQKGGFSLKEKEFFSEKASQHYGQTLEILNQSLESLSSSLRTLGLESSPLSKKEIIEHIYALLNPKRSIEIPPPSIISSDSNELMSSPREQLVFGDLVLGFESFTLDSVLHRLITLKTLPETTYAGQMASFLRLPFHYDLTLAFEVPSQTSEMAKLRQKQRMAHSLAVSHGGKATDLESETKLSSTEELMRELLSSGQRIYSMQLNILLKAPNTLEGKQTLNRQVREVLSRMRTLQGAEGLEETIGAWKILRGNLPAAPMTLERAKKVKTNNLVDFLPVYGSREGDPNPIVLLRNRMTGLVSYDPFDSKLPNYNALVTGSSGAGKSFLNNCILLQELARGLRVFIIDIGGSYKKLTKALGGKYLEMDLSERHKLNPFDIPNPTKEPTNQKIKSLLAVIETMVSEDDKGHLPKLDRVLLEKAILELYRKKRLH